MILPEFDTQFSPRPRFRQAVGSRLHRLYQSQLSDDGTIELVDAGTEDIYDAIQSHKDSTDIHVLLKRFQAGDVDVLSKVQGSYGDFTEMPKTYADALNAMIAGEQLFNSLPLETREKFDFSLHKFILAMDDWPSFSAALGIEQPSVETVEEVMQNESEQ